MKIKKTQLNFILLGVLLTLALTVVVANPVNAQDPTPSDDEVNAIAKQLYCPVCENIPLDTCGTQACKQWRGIIRDKLGEGWSEAEIKQYFVDQYGDRVLAEPPRRGLNWLAYIVPPAAFAAGAYLLYKGFRTWSTASEVEAEQNVVKKRNIKEMTKAEVDEYIAVLEAELKNR